jgi:penicillin amidase
MSNRGKRWRTWLGRGLVGVALLAAAAALSLWLLLRGSLAQLDGQVAVSGLHAAVTVTRDQLGVPTITGHDRQDVAYATGYLHAQDRFFEMDCLRRSAAGELAELVGPPALPLDRRRRLHRFRARAEAALKAATPAERALLDRYTAGVNDGLAALSVRPFEYALLRTAPVPWRPADSLLVVWAMYFELQGYLPARELARGWLKEHTTAEQLAFLLPTATPFDAPINAPTIADPPPPLPATAPAWLGGAQPTATRTPERKLASVGSNNWALAGARTQHGGAIVANDMHLGIRLPHIWYRAVLQFPDAHGQQRRVAGVTLPGGPVIVVGSNGHVAWGFTNSYGDYLDLIALPRDPADPSRVQTPTGWEKLTTSRETLAVRGAPSETLTVEESSLGPVWQVADRSYALHWMAHAPGAVNMGLSGLEEAADLLAALAVGNRTGMPAQNMVVGDAEGHIGWTIAGPLPDRTAMPEATFPLAAGDGALTWKGPRAPADYPRVVDPAGGQLWTANARQLAGADYAALGDGGADLGARAQQIRDDLLPLAQADERAVYQVALDDRALFIGRWRERALQALDPAALGEKPQRAELRRLLSQSWDGRASVDSVGYLIARSYLHALYDELFGGVDAQLARLMPTLDYKDANSRWPQVLARLLDERPKAWLPAGRTDWHQVELLALNRVIAELTHDGRPLAAARWGARNAARISHPFAALLPPRLAARLSAPADEQAGDSHMPHVAGPSFGQSERMAVTPGHEERGIFNMPGGQSGHPLSPYFLAGHAAWVRGEPTPFLPGPPVHTLVLTPQ